MSRFMSPVIVNDGRTGKPIAVMKDDPEGRYVHWCDAYAQCSAPSASAPVEVTKEMVERAIHELDFTAPESREHMRRALTAALKGKS